MTRPGRRANRVAFGALLLGLFVLPLYPKIGLVSVAGTYIPIRLDDVITVGVLLVWITDLLAERRLPRIPSLALPVVLWVAAGFVALVVGAALQHTITWGTGALYWAKPIEYLLLGWMAYDLVTTRRRITLFSGSILSAAAVVVAYGVLQRFGWAPTPPSYLPGSTLGVVTATFGDPHQLAGYLGLIAFIVIALWHQFNGLRLGLAILLVGLAYVLVHTGVRSEFIALTAGTVAFLRWRPTRAPAALLLVALFASAALPNAIERELDRTISRSAVIGTPDDGRGSPAPAVPGVAPGSTSVGDRIGDGLSQDVSLSLRLQDKWPKLLRVTWAHPLFGGGPSAATEAADGYYVRSLVEVGLVGTAAFLALVSTVLVAFWKGFRRATGPSRWLALAALTSTLFVGIVGILIDTWVASRPMQLYWPLVGATLATLQTPGFLAPGGGSGTDPATTEDSTLRSRD